MQGIKSNASEATGDFQRLAWAALLSPWIDSGQVFGKELDGKRKIRYVAAKISHVVLNLPTQIGRAHV